MAGRKKRPDSVQVGPRVDKTIIDRLAGLAKGKPSTVASKIIYQFIALKELEKDEVATPIITPDGTIMYATMISDDSYHLTFKKGHTIITSELKRQDLADLAFILIDLLNQNSALKIAM